MGRPDPSTSLRSAQDDGGGCALLGMTRAPNWGRSLFRAGQAEIPCQAQNDRARGTSHGQRFRLLFLS